MPTGSVRDGDGSEQDRRLLAGSVVRAAAAACEYLRFAERAVHPLSEGDIRQPLGQCGLVRLPRRPGWLLRAYHRRCLADDLPVKYDHDLPRPVQVQLPVQCGHSSGGSLVERHRPNLRQRHTRRLGVQPIRSGGGVGGAQCGTWAEAADPHLR